ncbi:cytochrome P450 [Vitiosangium sp. GDMCC 1.1324]|uniref:cytochrome P450 n=1 Tax=Vitiosangium sp. (strain GDMCC 1.1324) TaxID=2138576 RepID=UPI000D36A717|nr:cytochrome P450 [Vitiosangium sp. GDMCC 1.1324]PTL81650.1 cytochrome P450 [Vitiosangium sp. GDMCC 1.1324]
MAVAVSLKPLNRVPGSFIFGNLEDFKNNRLELLLRVKETCGEVGSFRLGPLSVLVVSSPHLAHTILVNHPQDFDGGPLVRNFMPLVGERSVIFLQGEPHRLQRKLLAPIFQPRRLAAFSTTMVQFTLDTLERWQDGQHIDVVHEMGLLTMRVAGKVLFDVDFLNESPELNDAVITTVEHLEHMTSSMPPLPLFVPTARNRKALRALDTISRSMKAMIDERRHHVRADSNDLLSLLLQQRDDEGQPMDDGQIRDHIMTFFAAGNETTAFTLSWVLYLLARHPEVHARVRHEVDSVLGGRPPTYEDLPALGYLLQVIKETLRLYPVVYMQARCAVRDLEIDGYAIRKGQMLLIPPYCIHRDSEYFPEPERFDPERFSPEREKQIPRHAYMPFGAGPHTCIGNHFALMEAHLIMATLVQRLDFEMLAGQVVTPKVAAVTLQPSRYQMKLTHRPHQEEDVSRPRARAAGGL